MSLRLNILLCGVFLLSACGFEPMYGEHSALATHTPLQGNLVLVTPKDRDGQLLKIALEDKFNPESIKSINPEYTLITTLSQTQIPTVITANGTIQRYDIRFDSTFRLLRNSDNKELFKGTAYRSGSYNVAPNENFSTYESEQTAVENVVGELAEDYVLRLTGYFAKEQ
jgi:LPS-assembly lipoprotein